MTKTLQKGFNAYPDIKALTVRAYGDGATVQASIFGDDFSISLGGQEILKGSSEKVRSELLEKLGRIL